MKGVSNYDYDIINITIMLTKQLRSYKRWLNRQRRHIRYMFPSPAEVQFIRIMGGRVYTIERLRHYRTGFPLVLVLWRGWVLWRFTVRREVYARGYYLDFCSRRKRAIEIDGRDYHDRAADRQRDYHLQQAGWSVFRIPAWRLDKQPDLVRRETIQFLRKGHL